jgi:hypothetical protein
MTTQTTSPAVEVECLSCGERRLVARTRGNLETGECPRCGYLGWASPGAIDERERGRHRRLRARLARGERDRSWLVDSWPGIVLEPGLAPRVRERALSSDRPRP